MYTSLLLALLPAAFAAPLITPREARLISNKFIVKFKSDVVTAASAEAKAMVSNAPDYEYSFGKFKGFAGTLSDEEVAQLKALDYVESIEQDAEVTIQAYQTDADATWGLGRISHEEPGSDEYIYDSSSGEGTCSYVLDTGIMVDHPEFEGRAEWLENTTGDGDDSDGYGHGTHVAGTIGSRSYGVAKKTSLYAVKVLDASGGGTWAGIIAGIDFVANDAQTRSCPNGALANMSLGGGRNEAVNAAVAAAIESGVFFSLSAGNGNTDASRQSPASEETACTVGATDSADARASFSNYGPIVDIFAPGVQVLSTWNNGETNTISGTSMAAPHIAGLAAYLAAYENSGTSGLCARIRELAVEGVITDLPSDTVNLLAFNGAPDL